MSQSQLLATMSQSLKVPPHLGSVWVVGGSLESLVRGRVQPWLVDYSTTFPCSASSESLPLVSPYVGFRGCFVCDVTVLGHWHEVVTKQTIEGECRSHTQRETQRHTETRRDTQRYT